MTNFAIKGRKVRFTSEGGSTHDLSRAHLEKEVARLQSKDNLSASSKETLARYEQAIKLAKANGL